MGCGGSSQAAAPKKCGSGNVQIYGVPPSGSCLPCVLLCKDYKCGGLEFCNIMEGAHKTPEMLALNPFHQIPIMKDGDVSLAECDAVLRHIARNYAEATYPMMDYAALNNIDWALSWDSTNFSKNFSEIWYPVAGFGPAPPDQKASNDAATENLANFEKKFLSKGKFIGGEKLCIADYKIGVKLWYLRHPATRKKAAGFELPFRCKKYADDWFQALSEDAKKFLTATGDSPFASGKALMDSKENE